MTKICTTCKQEKDLEQFHKNNQNKDGYLNICKECKKASYEEHKEKYLARQRLRRANRTPEQRQKDRQYAQQYRAENLDYVTQRAKEYESRPDVKIRRQKQKYDYVRRPDRIKRDLLKLAKDRARKQNVPFDLTEEDIELPEVCPVLGLKLEKGIKHPCDQSPSIDKIKPDLGYVRGNIKVISFRANTLKRDASIEELKAILKYMEENE